MKKKKIKKKMIVMHNRCYNDITKMKGNKEIDRIVSGTNHIY